jgi:hypothetical protein
VGAGGSLPFVEAPYALSAPLPAGSWGLTGDGAVAGTGVTSATVRFEVRWRKQGAPDDSGDVIVAAVEHTFVRDLNNPFAAIPYFAQLPGQAAAAAPGDLLILRTTFVAGDPTALFILNGDGKYNGGQIPRLDLPK